MNKLLGVIAISAFIVSGCATQDDGFDAQSEQGQEYRNRLVLSRRTCSRCSRSSLTFD